MLLEPEPKKATVTCKAGKLHHVPLCFRLELVVVPSFRSDRRG